MRKWLYGAVALIVVLPVSAAPKSAAPKAPDQTIASWTEKKPTETDVRTENTLTLRAGSLQEVAMLFSKNHPEGEKFEHDIKLSRIKSISTNSFQQDNGTTLYRIGMAAKGDKDLIDIMYGYGGSRMTSRIGGLPGFANFGPDQKDVRDQVYGKLCALVSAGVCTAESN